MFILNNTAAPPTGTCMFTGDPAQPSLSHGIISTASPVPYLVSPLVQSRISTSVGVGSGTGSDHTADRTIIISGANITLQVKAATLQTGGMTTDITSQVTLTGANAKFRALFSGDVPPGGFANIGFDLIPTSAIQEIVQKSGASATNKMHAEVLATVTLIGAMSGNSVSGTPWTFPVTVCNDCVVVNSGGTANACPLTVSQPRTGNPCNPYQDGIVDCCLDTTMNLVCPGTHM
jgi:hypothetical protein